MTEGFGKFLVIGGGIGGCSAALALHKAGCDVEIFESAPAFAEIGAGINITSAAAGILTSFGILDALLDPKVGDGVESTVRHYYSPDGVFMYEEQLGLKGGEAHPQLSMHRAKLHNTLVAACRERLGANKLHLNHEFTHVEQDANGVTAYFKDLKGQVAKVTGSFLIGCDGLQSKVRAQMCGEVMPRYTGWTIYRGMTVLPFEVLDGRSILLTGDSKGVFICYPVSDGLRREGKTHCNWAFAQVQAGPEAGENWTNQSSVEDIRALMQTYTLKVGELTPMQIAERSERIIGWALFDRDPISKWVTGRVALLGDSAHPLLPFGSQGGTQAIIDCEALHTAFSTAPRSQAGAKAALAQYEQMRAGPAAKVVLSNREMGPTKILRAFEDKTQGMTFEQKEAFAKKSANLFEDLVQSYRKEVMAAHKQSKL